MDAKEYLRLCTEQIRCKAIRPAVEKELRDHLEEQTEAYLAEGMCRKEAEEKAVKDMGDPVEAGVGLDRVHRPRMDLKTVGLILLLAAAGLFLQFILAEDGFTAEVFPRFCRNTVLGIGVMFFACFVDVSRIGRYPRLIWLLLLGAGFWIGRVTPFMNGEKNTAWFAMLLVPAFAGIVFYYRSQKGVGAGKVLAWLFLTGIVLSVSGGQTIKGQLFLLGGGIVLLGYAVAKGWYGIKRRWALAIFGIPAAGLVSLTVCALASGGFRAQRLKAWLNPAADVHGAGYFQARIWRELAQISFFVPQKELVDEPGFWIANSENYTLLLLARWYGFVVVAVVLALLLLLAAVVAVGLGRQKNRLGILVGAGCLWTLGCFVCIHVAANFGLLPATDCSLPFISTCGKEGLALYCLMGLLLSVFRTRTTMPEPTAEKNIFGWELKLVRTKQ